LQQTGVNEVRALRIAIANAGLAEGYGALSAKALRKILPALRAAVITYDKAVQAAGFEHHSHIRSCSLDRRNPSQAALLRPYAATPCGLRQGEPPQ
jgi:hypothetical protein